ncbi:hypothetical protein EDB19DRAFT_1628834, partial [Suillus lakei]
AKNRSSGIAVVYALTESSSLIKGPVDITKALLSVLSENARLGETQGVIESFNELVSTFKIQAWVVLWLISATPFFHI